ncbi:hypothetical protein TSAR_001094 [Trichomalopsis sarcophagae]|uniref:non-specific serine/threonine protein kinase n=1 Tax=Trichomalopsis sarcophagae TaxID=543379 RepID=A0A232F5L9_9HYME|nr:hypothetical protein TSAR_001094 [Trichomalopsis sarcophagae]
MSSYGSTSIGTKLKIQKNSEKSDETVVIEQQDNEELENNETLKDYNVGDILRAPRATLFICQRNSSTFSADHSFSRFKTRSSGEPRNEFRMARGGISGDRGRGGSSGGTRGRAFKKTVVDREPNADSSYSHSSSRPKFQESLKNQENKYYDDKKINEDSRISKLLRRLCREDDYDHFLALCKQLQEGIVAPENQRYIRRNLDVICENLMDILYSGPSLEAKQQVAKCLGRIGYVADQDFKRFMDWIFNKYSVERKDDVKCLLMKSFGESLKLDTEAPKLKDHSVAIMMQLQSALENVDRSDLLIATVDSILLIIDMYPESFTDHFRDTVDILVGWHIDSTQQKSIVAYASRSLQRLRNFWIADLQFTLTLLGQFLEDMESYDEELSLPGSGRSSPGEEDALPCPKDCVLRITSLIAVFNTVLRCIEEHLNPSLTPNVQWSFLTDCLSKMLRTVVKAMELDDGIDIITNNDTGLSQENVDSITQCMKNMNLSQKSIDALLKSLNKDDEVNEENLVKLIKSLNLKKNDKKNSKYNDKDALSTVTKDKEESLINMLKSMDLRIKRNSDLSEEKEELVVVANECIYLLLGHLQSRVSKNHDLLYKFIDLQLQRVSIFWDDSIVSMLNTISKVIKEVSANLPLDLVHTLLGKNSTIVKLRFRSTVVIQNAVLGVYHSLLSLKNIPLLQEAYRYILADLENAYKTIIPGIEPLVQENPLTDSQYHRRNAEIVLIFLLRALSDIANASNSIIGMWALKPSILELLAVKLRPHDPLLSVESPLLQYHILFLLFTHCSKYNHFVPSSSLITGTSSCRPLDIFPGTLEVPTVSPTSGHLSIILNLIAKTIENKRAPDQTLLLLLDWIQEIYLQAENYIGVLSKTEECQTVVSSLLVCGATTNHKVSMAVCKNIESLLKAKQVSWSEEIYSNIVDLATLHLTSLDKTVRETYGHLLMNIPLNIVIPKLNKAGLLSDDKKFRDIQNYSCESLILAQRLHMRSNNGEMQAQHFKTYMAFLLQEYYFDAFGLSEVFTLCWPTISDNETMAKMYELALANRSFLFFWGGFEAAQHCALNKLRTPLGKPQETFTTIEGALKTLAREISCTAEIPKKDKRGLDYLLHEHTRVRQLVEFLEHLERVIHNAAEGCAVALLPHSKPVRTFFHTNRSTCKEWLNRIRLALCVVSLHAGLATNALRNGQRLLEDLCTANNTQGAEFERATLCTARAMVMLGEAEALQGLYVYCKEKDRKFVWLKAAMEEAAGKHELAAENYRRILEDQILTRSKDDSKAPEIRCKNEGGDSQVAVFCMDHLCKCFRSVGDWKQLEAWKQREAEILDQDKNFCLRRQMLENIAPQQATCLRKFEEAEELSLKELSDWTLLDEEAKTNWSCAKTMIECNNTLTNIALRIHAEQAKELNFHEEIERCKKVAARTMEEGLRNVPSEYLNDAILVQYSATGLADLLAGCSRNRANVFELPDVEKLSSLSSSVLTQVLWWSNYLTRANKDTDSNENATNEVDALRLHVARSARKEGNFGLAQRELGKYLSAERHGLGTNGTEFREIVEEIASGAAAAAERLVWSKDNMRAFRETSKLLYDMECTEEALKICSVTALGISKSIVSAGEQAPAELRETGTRVLLTLAKWIQQDAEVENNAQLDELLRFESLHNDGLMDKLFGKTTELIPTSDVIVGKLVQLGVNQCPDLPTAWSNFAAWCYKWGRKIVDNPSSGLLTDADKANIQQLLPLDVPETDLNVIYTILGQKNRVLPEDEGDIDTNDINTSETIEHHLRSVPILNCASSEHLMMLVDVWRQAQARIYAYYELSANAYFKYLQLAKDANDCETITATLRLLRLVVKHASELQNVLESGLSTTPTGPWKEIIPQLFSRLSHPECYVRTRVSELLCRVAENSPHLITFPAVVGAVSCGQNKSFEAAAFGKESSSDEPCEVDYFISEEGDYQQDANQGFMEACFAQLTDCLSSRIPDSVDQVKILVRELRRITLLWDELWLATLCQHHSDITKRFEQLEIEVQKVQDNIWLSPEEKDRLIAEKHRIILKPIIFILENLLAMTSVPVETPHEKYFQEKFGPCIERVIDKLKNPKNPARPSAAALPLKQLEAKLAQKVHKRGAYSLLMSDISPTLAKFKDTSIAMPGISTTKMVTIKSVDNNVQILPTKTKPKKLIFRGSDGHVYTYLFKGLEDLHLDERIMQFLSICNTMMSKNNDNTSKKVYRARHYSVIPLGPRSGLIQWVDGVTPLFALYKRWQQRETAMGNKGTSSAVLRPSELFYSKLTPLLKERGISTENRKEWPLAVLKQVLAELMAETPKDLLAKEIWCNSINAGSWWQATKNYSYSVAVMSIIGYIIGLGDRHLDNVLVDLNTGEVVHIDYNVCFEKGKTLRVPEKVPFRMTPNIKTALGVTGVEGIFRLACEHTLRVMRRGAETLLTLLEAFVYDPLVDWRAGAENSIATYGACQARARCTGVGRKQLELELTAAMFAVRIAEMRAEWLANKEELTKCFPTLCHRLSRWIEACEAAKQCQESLQDRHRQLALVKEAQAMGRNHALYSVVKRYNTYKRSKDVLEKAKVGLKERIDDCQKQINTHNMALSAVRGGQLGRWLSELGSSTIQEDHLVFDLVKEFLQNAGQSQMIIQCEQSENELTQLAVQQSILIRSCLDLLSQYSAICNLYPLSSMAQHRSVLYHAWASKLLMTGTVDACHEVLAQMEGHFSPVSAANPRVQRTVAFSYQVQAILSEANDKFTKAYERMIGEGLPDALVRIEKAYVDSKAQIVAFLRREKTAEKALECVNISALCTLNKKYLMMEGAAKCAGDCLVDLTSREGDWFLDEMRLMSSLIAEMISLIPESHKSNSDPKISLVFKCLKSADSIHKGLQELNYNFHTIILPEATKTIITEEPSVMRMVNELDKIIALTGMSLVEILEQLEMHLRFTIMEMESPHAIMQTIVDALKLRFEALLSRPADLQELNQEETLTPGQMLLMGFNGLFEKLQIEGNALISTLSSLDIPPSWKKIDQIREAKDMAAPIFNEAARKVLEDIFLVKRLHTIQKFFSMCRDIAFAFRGDTASIYEGGLAGVYSDEQLNKPIRLFTADYVSRQLIGVTSQSLGIALCFLLQRMGLNVTSEIEQRDIGAESKVSLEELCRKAIDMGMKKGLFGCTTLSQVSALSTTLESSWRRKQSAKAAQQAVEVSRATVQRLQLQLTAHYWLHEDYLMIGSNMNLINPINRPSFMLELRKTAAGLSNLQARVNEAREQQQNLVQSAIQRLKWAAGVNPALNEVMAAFDNAVFTSCEKLTRQANLSAVVVNACNSILHYEALRTRTQESVINDANLAKLVKRWEESCMLTSNLTITVTPIEESLVELLQISADNNIDANWLKQTEKLISDAIVEAQKKAQERQEALCLTQQAMREQVGLLQAVVAEHHRLMNDVRLLLRSMAKQENIIGLQEFLMNYRSCTESLSATVKELESENLDPNKAALLKMELETLAVKTPALYDELLSFANESMNEQNVPEFAFNKAKLIRQDSVCLSPRKGVPPARDPTTGKAVQERNAYALNVWRRVRMKLEGREPNPNRKYTTAEQVEYVIREAQSIENLALLYEGWTPWV